jgi:hypothetical protein
VRQRVAELDVAPGHPLRVLRARRRRGHAHGLDRARDVAVQPAQVGDARVGGGVGPQVDHPLRGLDRRGVLAQLDERVGQRAVDVVVPRVERLRAPRDFEPLLEAVEGEQELGAQLERVVVVGR